MFGSVLEELADGLACVPFRCDTVQDQVKGWVELDLRNFPVVYVDGLEDLLEEVLPVARLGERVEVEERACSPEHGLHELDLVPNWGGQNLQAAVHLGELALVLGALSPELVPGEDGVGEGVGQADESRFELTSSSKQTPLLTPTDVLTLVLDSRQRREDTSMVLLPHDEPGQHGLDLGVERCNRDEGLAAGLVLVVVEAAVVAAAAVVLRRNTGAAALAPEDAAEEEELLALLTVVFAPILENLLDLVPELGLDDGWMRSWPRVAPVGHQALVEGLQEHPSHLLRRERPPPLGSEAEFEHLDRERPEAEASRRVALEHELDEWCPVRIDDHLALHGARLRNVLVPDWGPRDAATRLELRTKALPDLLGEVIRVVFRHDDVHAMHQAAGGVVLRGLDHRVDPDAELLDDEPVLVVVADEPVHAVHDDVANIGVLLEIPKEPREAGSPHLLGGMHILDGFPQLEAMFPSERLRSGPLKWN